MVIILTEYQRNRGRQPFFTSGHHLVGTLALRDMRRTLRTWLHAKRNTLHISAVARQRGNHGNNKLSRHHVSTMTSHWLPLCLTRPLVCNAFLQKRNKHHLSTPPRVCSKTDLIRIEWLQAISNRKHDISLYAHDLDCLTKMTYIARLKFTLEIKLNI